MQSSKNRQINKQRLEIDDARVRQDRGGREIQNLTLRTIPDAEFTLIEPHLEYVELAPHLVLHEPGNRIDFAYFLNSGLISLVIVTADGRSVEVAMVGKEGVAGTPLALGLRKSPHRAIVQISGAGYKVKFEAVDAVMRNAPEMRTMLNRYVLAQGLQVAQIAACNRLHEIEQRLARWLLMCQDRVDSDRLPITHQFLAQMLGTGRPSVSLAAGILQRAGIIENLRGVVKIVQRKLLEDSACECYCAIQAFDPRVGI